MHCENAPLLIVLQSLAFFDISRYAIGYAERSGPKANIGWLSSLANATDQPYQANNTGGPTLKVKTAQRIHTVYRGPNYY